MLRLEAVLPEGAYRSKRSADVGLRLVIGHGVDEDLGTQIGFSSRVEGLLRDDRGQRPAGAVAHQHDHAPRVYPERSAAFACTQESVA